MQQVCLFVSERTFSEWRTKTSGVATAVDNQLSLAIVFTAKRRSNEAFA